MQDALHNKLKKLQHALALANQNVARLSRERQVALVSAIKLEAQIAVVKELLEAPSDVSSHDDII